jgi:O-methyltransferase involved in polyketide biosynthesis
VAFDYTEPLENQSPERRARLTAMADGAAARGEPWLSFFNAAEIAAILRAKGFNDIEDLAFADVIQRYSPELGSGLQSGGGHVIRAAR